MWYKIIPINTTNYLVFGKSTVIIKQIALGDGSKAVF